MVGLKFPSWIRVAPKRFTGVAMFAPYRHGLGPALTASVMVHVAFVALLLTAWRPPSGIDADPGQGVLRLSIAAPLKAPPAEGLAAPPSTPPITQARYLSAPHAVLALTEAPRPTEAPGPTEATSPPARPHRQVRSATYEPPHLPAATAAKWERVPPFVAPTVETDVPYVRLGHDVNARIITEFPIEVARPVKLPPHLAVPYPSGALAGHPDRTVILWVIVGADGVPEEMHLVQGSGALAQAAIDAVGSARYSPAINDGKAIRFHVAVKIDFPPPPAETADQATPSAPLGAEDRASIPSPAYETPAPLHAAEGHGPTPSPAYETPAPRSRRLATAP